MRMALRLAEKAKGGRARIRWSGAVLVKSGKVISRGYHEKAGMPHAEVVALTQGRGFGEGLDPLRHA